MRRVFLAPDRTFDVAPLTLEQCNQLRRDTQALPVLSSPDSDELLMLLQLRTCYCALTNASGQKSIYEIATELTCSDLESFFRQVLRLTFRALERPAFARRRGH